MTLASLHTKAFGLLAFIPQSTAHQEEKDLSKVWHIMFDNREAHSRTQSLKNFLYHKLKHILCCEWVIESPQLQFL